MSIEYDFGNPEFDNMFDRLFDDAMDTVIWDADMLLANINCEVNTPPTSDIYRTAAISRNDAPDWVNYRIGEYKQPWHEWSDYTRFWWDDYRAIEPTLARWAAIWRYANDRDYAPYNCTDLQEHMAANAYDLADYAWTQIDSIMDGFCRDMESMLESVYDSMIEYLRDETVYQLTCNA